RGIQVFWQETVFSMAIAVVVTLSMTWVGLLVINSLLVLPGAAARNVAGNMARYHLLSVAGAVAAGVAGLLTSYGMGASAGAAITLYLAGWFFVTFLWGKRN
ncbi:MAG: metal ABC transporter permease, partial [Lawsonibacter sp.]